MCDCSTQTLLGFFCGIVATFLFVLWYGKRSSTQHRK